MRLKMNGRLRILNLRRKWKRNSMIKSSSNHRNLVLMYAALSVSLPLATFFPSFPLIPFSDARSLTRTNSNGPTPPSSKAAEPTTSAPRPSLTQTTSTAASSSLLLASAINPIALTSDGHTSSTQPNNKKSTTTFSCNYRRRCLKPSKTAL